MTTDAILTEMFRRGLSANAEDFMRDGVVPTQRHKRVDARKASTTGPGSNTRDTQATCKPKGGGVQEEHMPMLGLGLGQDRGEFCRQTRTGVALQ